MKNYYVLSNGRIMRKDNTLFIENASTGEKRPIPVEDVQSLYVYGEVDLNTKLLNFLTQKRIVLHVFNYYGFYAGSYYPREYLNSGFLMVRQAHHYSDPICRMRLAREIVRGSAHSILRNVSYYGRRRGVDEALPEGEVGMDGGAAPAPAAATYIPADAAAEGAVDSWADVSSGGTGPSPLPAGLELPTDEGDGLTLDLDFEDSPPPLVELRATIEGLAPLIETQARVNDLRGVEGKIRERYYHAWRHILADGWVFQRRVKRPPDNEVNALISFGNSVLYTACLGEIYRTQLTPTISYLHEPGARRFSLALDLSEIFKPLIVDRAIFRLLNRGQLKEEHFSREMGGCFLVDTGKKLFLSAIEETMNTTIQHRRLHRHVTYRHLIRLECYKLIRHLSGLEEYKAFRAWW